MGKPFVHSSQRGDVCMLVSQFWPQAGLCVVWVKSAPVRREESKLEEGGLCFA